MPTASLVVLNWHHEQATALCVESLCKLDGSDDCEIVVVDNESTTSSREALARLERVTLVPLATNLGFAGGMNAGIAAARGDFIGLFNNDLVVEPGWLRKGLRALEDPKVGIVGGPQFPWGGEDPSAFCAAELREAHENTRDPGLAMVHVDPERGFAVLGPAPTQRRLVAGVDGCNLLARAGLLRRLGGFDPDYFAYGEDVDLCARAWALGYATMLEPAMRVWHRRGASSDRVARQRAFWAARNQVTTVAKHFMEASWRRTAALVAFQHLSEALLGHPGGIRSASAVRLSHDERAGRIQAALWTASHARWLATKRAATIAAGQHDEGYTEHLRGLLPSVPMGG
ncbi:MAG: glycosyltransferase family 2 protein [Acidimicrobiales bacterium]